MGITRTASALRLCLAMLVLVGNAYAVDFVFHYDDPAGFGFFDPSMPTTGSGNLGDQRRAAMEAAGDIWGRLIRPSYPGEEIVVRAKFDPLATGTLASAKPHYFYSDFGSSNPQYQGETNYPKALANHLAGRDLAPQRHEIEITVNETVTTFYYLLDGMAAPAQRDFVTILAHELGHGLGFYDSFKEDGDYGLHGDGEHVDPGCIGCLPTPYDRFVTLGQMGQTLLSLSDDDARQSATVSSNVFWNGASGIAANGGTAPRVDSVAPFVVGRTIDHVDVSLGSLMVPGYLGVRQTISAVERGMMRDMGWNVSVAPTPVNWTGAGADNRASTPANWSTAIPLPGDSLAFGPSPRTDVNMDLTLYSIGSISFAADAPAYTLTFDRQKSTDITVGITNNSSQTQKIVVANGFANSPDQRGATLTFKTGTSAANATFEVLGGGTAIEHPPNLPPRYVHGAGGRIVFEGNARAGSASFTVGGGAGFEGPAGMVIFRGGATPGAPGASAGSARFHNKAGIYGVRLPGPPANASGYGGETRFEGNSNAGTTARFRNDGEAESIGGTGGITTFTEDASAGDATFENFGATQSAQFGALGGFTRFLQRSSASTGDFINYEGTSNVDRGMGETQFWDDARAGTANFTNMGATLEGRVGGVTRFHDRSTAENGTFTNLGGGLRAGGTEFYDDSNAGRGTFVFPFNPPGAPTPVGSGRTEFFDRSVASAEALPRAEYTFQGGPAANSLGGGGTIWFHDNSRAGLARFTFERFSKGIINFVGRSRADRAEFVMQDLSFGRIAFYRDSSASDRTYDITAGGGITFGHAATAGAATITIQNGASGTFGQPELLTDIATAADATIRVMGATLNNPPGVPIGGRLGFNPGSTAGNARITIEGGVGAGATGARLAFTGGTFQQAMAGNATLIVNGGTNGGVGGTVFFQQGAKGGTARLVANAGGTFDFGDQRLFGGTEVGSIEGAGTFALNGSLLTTGNLNTSTTVSGQITDGFGGVPAMLTKAGTGTLTLAGDNTYTGLTTVAAGTLRVDGAIAGDALVKSGARLEGGGRIPRRPEVEGGGVFAPGTSPGTITVGGLTMKPGSTLEYEIGQTARDRIVLLGNGNVSLAGTLKLLPLDDAPTLGQSFSLFEGAVGTITGAFDTVIAPTFNGLTLNVAQNNNSVMLQVIADASEKVWGADSSGTVSLGGNWVGGIAPVSANESAAFTTAISAPRAVQLDTPLNLRSVRFDGGNAYTLQGDTLTLQAPGAATAVIQVRNTQGNGAHTIAAPVMVSSSLEIIQQSTDVFTLSGTLDNSAGRSITKSGAGTLTIAGAQTHGPGAVLTIAAGAANINTNAGSNLARNLTINANSTTNFGSTQYLAALNIGAGATVALTAATPTDLLTNSLVIAGGDTPTGRLDLNNHAAIVDFVGPSPADTIREHILNGRGGAGFGATWSGQGISSSAAAAAIATEPESRSIGFAENSTMPLGPYATFRGQPVDSTAVLIAFTRTADANLDGMVNDDDVTIVGATYAPGVPQPSWALGDFDYNGFVDDDDVTLLGAFYDPAAVPLISPPAEPGDSSPPRAGVQPGSVAAVPEPASLVLVALGMSLGVVAMICSAKRRMTLEA